MFDDDDEEVLMEADANKLAPLFDALDKFDGVTEKNSRGESTES